MAIQVLQPLDWDGQPKRQAEWFRLTKGTRQAVCTMYSHQFGWEMWLEIDGDLIQSHVCRDQEEVFSTWEKWQAAMKEKDWH